MLNRNLLLAGAACIGLSAAPAALSAQSIVIASDNASNYAPWEDGSNGGFGFGPWGISADGGDGGFAGVFTGNPGSAGITGLPDPSFSMFANPNTSGAFAVAARALANPLPVGGSLSFEWAVNWDSDGGNKGFNIFAGSDQVVNVNQGGFPGELFLNTVDTGLAYGTGPMLWTFTMESEDTLRVTSTARDGDTAAPPSVDVTVPVSNPLSGFAFYVDNMGGGDQRQPYFNNFEARIPAGPIVVDAPFADPAAVVAGRGAHPNSPVELFVDGAPAAQSIANAVGEFSFAPMALDGGEELVVRAQQSWYFDAGDEGFLNNDPSQATVTASGGNLVLTPTAAGSAPWIVAPLPPFGHPTNALRVLEIRMRNGAGTPTLAITTNSPALPTFPAFTIGLSTNPAEYATYLVPIVGEVQGGTQPPGTDNFLLALQFFPAGSTDPIEIDYIRVREDIAYEFDTDGDFQQFDFFDPFLDFAGVSDGALQLVANGTAPQRVFMLNQPFYNYDGNLFNRMHITQAVSSASANQLLWEYRTFEPPLVFDGVLDGNFVQVTDAIPDAAGTLFDNTGQMTTYILDPTGSPNFNNPAHERHPYFFWSFANLLSAGDTVSIDRIALTSANPFGPSAPVEVPIPPAVFNIATGLGYPDIDSAVQAPETLDGHVLEIREDLVGQLLPAGPNDTYPWKNVVLRGDDPTRTVTGRFNFIGAGLAIRIESLNIDAAGQANPITVGMGAIVELEDVHVANSGANGVRMMNTGGTLAWNGGSSTGHAGNGIANQGGVIVAEGVSISGNGQRGLFAVNTTSTTTLVDCTVANNALAGITAAAVASGHAIVLDGTDLVGNNTAAGEAPGAQVILNGGAFSMSGGSFSGTGNFDVFAVETNGQGGSTADFTGVSFGTAAANNFIISNNYDFLFVDCTIASTGGFVFNPRNGTTTVRDSVINAPRIANYGFATNGASPALVIEDTAINATGLGAQLFQFNNGSFDGGGESFRADNTLEIRGSRIVWNTVGAPGNMAIGLNGEHTVAIVVEDTDIVDAFGGGGGFFNNQPQAVYNLSMAGSTMKDFGNAIVDLGEAVGGSITIDQCDFLSTAGRRTALLLLPAAVSTVAITDSIFSDAAIFNQAPGATVSEDFNFLDQRGGATLLNGPIASGGSSIATAGVANGFSALYCSTDFGDPKYLAIATQSPANGLNSVGPETYAGAKGVDCDACDDDQFPPVLACAAPFAIQTVDGIASVDEADIVLSLTDNCTTATIVSPSFPVTFFAPGVYTVTVVAADEAGNTATCSVQVTVEQEPGPDVPGDTCETAIDISAGGVFPFDTTDASDNDPFWGPGYPTVFFEWTTPAAGIWVLDTCGSSFNTWVSVYVAPNCPTGEPALNPNNSLTICPGDEVVSGQYILTVPAGLRIVVSVQGFDVDEAGPGVLSSYFTPNDEAPLGLVGGANCQEATPVGKGTYDIDLTAFGDPVVPASFLPDSGAPSTDPATLEPAAWVSYTPVETGLFWISLCNGTNFDTTLAVYESCPTGITDADPLIALNDDSTACTSGVGASALGLMGEAGQTYLIAISAFPGTPTGQARLQITGAQAQTNLSELVTWPPIPGLPFVELDGPAYGAIDRLAFLVIDEDGTITGAFDLADSGQRLSAKGLHVLVDDASGGGQPPVRSIFEWPVIYPFLATLGEADLISNPLDPFGLLLDGPARTFVLVRDFSGSIGDTIDPEGDGTVGATPWQRTLDAVSYSFGPSFFEYGAQLGGTSLGTPRNFDDSGDHFADWMFRDIATGEWQTAELDGFFGGPGDPEQPGTRAARDFDAFVAFGAGPGPFLSDERYANLAATPGFYNPLETAPVAGVLQDFSDTECGTSLVLLWDGFFDAETLVQAYEVTLGLAPGGDDLFGGVVSSNTRSLILSVGSPLPQGLDLFWTVTAVNDVGQLTSAGLGITILDTTPPVVADVELDVFLDATGNGSIALADLLSPDTTDNCSTPVVIDADRLDFDCDDAFATLDGASPTITFVVSDAVGNTATGTATINVFDDNPVTLVTQPFVVFLDANGQATVSPDSFVNFALSGAGCGTITAVSVVPDTFTCADAAATQAGQIPTVVVTVSDEFGNTATGTTIAPVADAVEPALFCLEEVTIPVSALDGTVLITADDLFSSPPVDACGIQSIQLSRTLFDCGDVAATLAGNPPVVTVVVRDIYNNSSTCSVVVNIVDETPPVLVVADIDAILDGDGFASIDTADLVVSASDNCSFALSFDGPTEFTCDDLGEPIAIVVTATDPSGNTTTQTAFVTVIDPTDPVVECPDELIVVICNDPDGFFFVPDVTDNCAWTYSIDGFPDAILPYGLTEGVTVRIFDALGEQTAVCVFDIEVIGDVQERLRLQSIAQFDGELTVNAAGAVVSLNSTATSFFVGDTTANNTTRGFLAMDTSAIPADAIISRAAVRLHRFNERGSSSDLGFLQVDILDPATTTPGIALEDFDSVPLFANAGLPVPPPPSIGGGMFIPLRSDAYDALDRGGLTIFRLQFPVDTDFDGLADGLSFGTGENGAFNTFTPELIVEFYTPTCDGCGINDPVFAGPDVIGPIAVPAIVGQTGFVTESFETSEVGGAANSTSTVFNVGDTALNQQTIGILSFNTGSVGIDPSDYIQRAELRLSRASARGDVSDLGGLVVDMRCLSWSQPFFGLSPAVEPADFQADVLPVPVAVVGQVGSSFDFSAELDAVGRENINRDGVTQMKLRFELDDNDNSRADNIGFFSANASVAARRPVLLLWIRPTTLQPRTSELADPSDRLTDFSDFQKDAGTIRALEQDFLLP